MTFWQVRAASGSTNIVCFRCDKRIDQWATAAWSDLVDRYYHISCVPYGQEIRIAPDDYFGDPLAELKPRVTGRDLLTTKIIEAKQAVIRETSQAINKMMSSDINVDLWGTEEKATEVKEPIVAPSLPTPLEVYGKAAIDELLRPLVAPALLRVLLKVAGVSKVASKKKQKPVDKDDTIAKDGEARAALLELD